MPYELEANVAREITAVCRSIGKGGVAHVDMGMSLSRDLCFDSGQLMQFFSRVEQLYAGLALESWFIEHRVNGHDTIGSMVRYIADALPRAAAESSEGLLQPDRDSSSAQGFTERASQYGQSRAEACGQGRTGRP